MKLFGLNITRASTIRRRLLEGKLSYRDVTHPKSYYYIMGVWDARIFGFCIYRNLKES